MMKLTVTFLAALAAADAAEARSNRLARRQYGYGNGGYGGAPAVSSAAPVETPYLSEAVPAPSSVVETPYLSSAAPVETPYLSEAPPAETPYLSEAVPEASSAAVPYVQSSAPVFETSSTPVEEVYSSATPAPSAGGDYGNGYGAAPPAGGASSYVPEVPAAVSSAEVPIESSYVPAESAAYGSGFSSAIPSAAPSVPAGAAASSPAAYVPTGAYPTGGAPSSAFPVEASSIVPSGTGVVPGTGYPLYPTGTGSSPASSTPLSDYVTKTIYSTQIYTKTSGTTVALETSVVPVGTTVCAESDYPEATPASATAASVVTSEYPVSVVTKPVTETLVYTIGVGSSAHAVTTEIVSTSTSTVYSTVVVTAGKPKPTGASGYPVEAESATYPEGEAPTGTSTIKSTSTTTKYVTVKPTGSATGPVGTDSYPTAPAGAAAVSGGNGEDCGAPITVTITAKETVYVTKGSNTPASTPAVEKPTAPESEYPAGSEIPGVPTATGKYPIAGNGTYPGYPAGPTGFKTSAKPAGPTGTGVYPTKPSETASLPYFSFVSEAPAPTETPAVPAAESSAPAAASSAAYPAYPAGGEYGAAPAAPSSAAPVETPYAAAAPSPSAVETPSAAYPVETPAAATSAPADNSYGSYGY